MSTGYTKCPHDLLRNPNLTPVEKIVWLFIASNEEGYTYSVKQACEVLGLAPKTWRKAVESLIEKNMIVAVKKGAGNTNSYSAILATSSWKEMGKNYPINWAEITQSIGQKIPNQLGKNYPIKEEQIKEQENNFINKIKSACACERNHDSPKSETHPNGEKETKLGRAREGLPIDALKTELLGSAIWIESIAKGFNLSQQEVQEYIAEFCEYLIQCGEECKPLQEAKKHFRNRLNILINGNNKQTKDAGDDRRLGVARLIARYTG